MVVVLYVIDNPMDDLENDIDIVQELGYLIHKELNVIGELSNINNLYFHQ